MVLKYCLIAASRINNVLTAIQCMEERIDSRNVIFRVVDCSADKSLIYNFPIEDEWSQLELSDVLDETVLHRVFESETKSKKQSAVPTEDDFSQVFMCGCVIIRAKLILYSIS